MKRVQTAWVMVSIKGSVACRNSAPAQDTMAVAVKFSLINTRKLGTEHVAQLLEC